MTVSNIKPVFQEKIRLTLAPKQWYNPQVWFLREMPICGALRTRYSIKGKEIGITNVHLDVMGGIDHKIAQIREAFDDSSDLKHNLF